MKPLQRGCRRDIRMCRREEKSRYLQKKPDHLFFKSDIILAFIQVDFHIFRFCHISIPKSTLPTKIQVLKNNNNKKITRQKKEK
jgi:hypothetical protein